MFVDEKFTFDVRINDPFLNSNILMINIKKLDLNICGYYGAPDTNINSFLSYFDPILEKYNDVIYIGDMNINLLNNNTPSLKSYLNLLKCNNLKLLNTISQDK